MKGLGVVGVAQQRSTLQECGMPWVRFSEFERKKILLRLSSTVTAGTMVKP